MSTRKNILLYMLCAEDIHNSVNMFPGLWTCTNYFYNPGNVNIVAYRPRQATVQQPVIGSGPYTEEQCFLCGLLSNSYTATGSVFCVVCTKML
jgi:predicted adenine nucleotide alpha hydrolase (AANH) superfamily ATPase